MRSAVRHRGALHLQDIRVPREAEAWMWRIGAVMGLVAVLLFAYFAVQRGSPRSTYFDDWEPVGQLALLAIASLGYLIALRWPGLGGAIIVQTAVALGVMATMEYSRTTAFLACAAFLVPGTLFLLSWQRTASLIAVTAVMLVVASLLVAGAYASNQVYAYYYGPTHPESSLEREDIDLVEWVWVGGVSDTAATVTARLAEEHSNVRVAVHPADDPGPLLHSERAAATAENDRIVQLTVEGLLPDTSYAYAIEANGGVEDVRRGTFETFPAGPASFTFAFSSCSRAGSNGAVFDAIRSVDPLFFLVTGDFHYENISQNDPGAFRSALYRNLTSPGQEALYQSAPVAYVWDDHDYGGNNADSTSSARPAARSAYREVVPHYPLPAGEGDAAIYQAFSAGRVRFLLTDTRSERSPSTDPDDGNKTMLGAEQKAWLKRELLAARDEHALIVWANSVPWISPASPGGDSWSGYDTERRELAAFITEHEIDNLLMVSGDAHMLAIDNGSNSAGGFPVFHAAALDRHGRVKGGPYSEGTFPGSGQFGLVTINDHGSDEVEVILSGRNWKNEEVVGYSFMVAATAP